MGSYHSFYCLAAWMWQFPDLLPPQCDIWETRVFCGQICFTFHLQLITLIISNSTIQSATYHIVTTHIMYHMITWLQTTSNELIIDENGIISFILLLSSVDVTIFRFTTSPLRHLGDSRFPRTNLLHISFATPHTHHAKRWNAKYSIPHHDRTYNVSDDNVVANRIQWIDNRREWMTLDSEHECPFAAPRDG